MIQIHKGDILRFIEAKVKDAQDQDFIEGTLMEYLQLLIFY